MSQHPSRKRPRDEDKSEEFGDAPLESGATPIKRSAAAAGSSTDPEAKNPLSGLPRDHTCLIYIVEKKISSGHLSHLKTVARKKGFPLATSASIDVTHVVTTLPLYERAVASLPSPLPPNAEIVTLEWLTTSFLEGKPAQVTDRYRLKKTCTPERLWKPGDADSKGGDSPMLYQPTEYECQRPTLLKHHNHIFTDALELLERYYQHVDYKQGDTRPLAFRQASCALKALPKSVTHIKEVSNLHRIGRHSKQVIQDLLSSGFSAEVEECKSSEWFQCMELFTSVYGCGSATAGKWYQQGLRTVEDVRGCRELQLTEIQRLGLKYYEHLSVPIPRSETEYITAYIQTQAEVCLPGTSVEAVGGFRRGKSHSHDVDLLLTHTNTSVTIVLLETLLEHLNKKGVVIHADATYGQNTVDHIQHVHVNTSTHTFTPEGRQRRVKFDHLDKAFCIMKFAAVGLEHGSEETREGQAGETPAPLIRRVDLIVSPPEQYPFALVSWTGSKQFNRSLRRYSVKECSMSVTAHGIYDIAQGKFIPAKSEKDVFSTLKLNYLEPWERNC